MKNPFSLLAPYLQPEPVLVVISGPAGVGKDSVLDRLKERGLDFFFVVTTTDRGMRPGEVDGQDYDFVSTERFEEMITNDELIEYAEVYGQYKGVPRFRVRNALASGADVIMRLDVQGAATVKQRFPGIVSIFLAPPSMETLVHRLESRQTDTPEQVKRRLDTALVEITRSSEFDYVIVNREGELDNTVDQVIAVMQAAKCSTARSKLDI